MKSLIISTNNVAKNSVKFFKSGIDFPTSLGKGVLLETLKKRMMSGEVCRFAYKKLSGEVRVACGTLQEHAVKANIMGTGVPKRFYGIFVYLDLEKMSWRGFREENFVGIID